MRLASNKLPTQARRTSLFKVQSTIVLLLGSTRVWRAKQVSNQPRKPLVKCLRRDVFLVPRVIEKRSKDMLFERFMCNCHSQGHHTHLPLTILSLLLAALCRQSAEIVAAHLQLIRTHDMPLHAHFPPPPRSGIFVNQITTWQDFEWLEDTLHQVKFADIAF